ncbi:NmrA family NAD(P)-binding protein [Sphaerisporangium corydalis]|uniref:NmrA family NAD(P)-binding protein n=1 Tax=Sphaerisporangium corydalis TaxID=1441875 RepID=A0ABV9EBK7_9ACTN|nr:NmrA family NAD(P)-binding protein [Sphaerisporangium corydalis]
MILVTGASGALGGLILDRLSAVPGLEVVAGTRAAAPESSAPAPSGPAPLALSGDTSEGNRAAGRPDARWIDFDRPETLATGFAGADVLVFVSAGYADDDVVIARHGAVVRAAAKAGVRHVIYTSLAGSGDGLSLALIHRWTEERLAEAPFEVTVLRNGLYAEVPVALALLCAGSGVASGVLQAPFGAGRVTVVAREDLADVAARVAAEAYADLAAGADRRHAGRVYELPGVAAIGGADIAAALAETLGRPVAYRTAPLAAARVVIGKAGLPAFQADHAISTLSNVNAGRLVQEGGDLPGLLAAPPRPVPDLVADAVKALVAVLPTGVATS